MANMAAYTTLTAEAKRVGWPRLWRTDLTVHDRRTLSRAEAPETFIWVLRECGTHLFHGAPSFVKAWVQSTAQNWPGDRARWYWYDGTRLIAYPSAEAVLRRLEDHHGRAHA